jgi:hypothetical protein
MESPFDPQALKARNKRLEMILISRLQRSIDSCGPLTWAVGPGYYISAPLALCFNVFFPKPLAQR